VCSWSSVRYLLPGGHCEFCEMCATIKFLSKRGALLYRYRYVEFSTKFKSCMQFWRMIPRLYTESARLNVEFSTMFKSYARQNVANVTDFDERRKLYAVLEFTLRTTLFSGLP
jgi:hypothetical protein